MASAVLAILGQIVVGVLLFTAGWVLRPLRDRHQADVQRDREWDRAHGIAGRDDG